MAAARCFIALLGVLAAALIGLPAHAQSTRTPENPSAPDTIERFRGIDGLAPRGGAFAHHLGRIDLSGKYGLVYTRNFDKGESGMQIRIRGPVLGRRRTDVGLSFEIRF